MALNRSSVVFALLVLIGSAGLTACTAPTEKPAVNRPVGPNPSLTPESDDEVLLREVCGEATEIYTLVRLPDRLITSGDPITGVITAERWLQMVREAKERAVELLRVDPGPYDSEIVAFATAVIAVSETPPADPLPADRHAALTEASVGLQAACEGIRMPIGILVPPSFGG